MTDNKITDNKIGVVSHYYDKINVAVVDLTGGLEIGDRIKIVKDDLEFEQEVESMQVDHKEVKNAKKGDSVGLKVTQEAKRKAEVYKI